MTSRLPYGLAQRPRLGPYAFRYSAGDGGGVPPQGFVHDDSFHGSHLSFYNSNEAVQRLA